MNINWKLWYAFWFCQCRMTMPLDRQWSIVLIFLDDRVGSIFISNRNLFFYLHFLFFANSQCFSHWCVSRVFCWSLIRCHMQWIIHSSFSSLPSCVCFFHIQLNYIFLFSIAIASQYGILFASHMDGIDEPQFQIIVTMDNISSPFVDIILCQQYLFLFWTMSLWDFQIVNSSDSDFHC